MSTNSISSEIRSRGVSSIYAKLLEEESNMEFPSVQKDFTVIDSDTRLTVVDSDIAKRIQNGNIDWRLLQRSLVQIKGYMLEQVKAPEILPRVYYWKFGYNDFLGFMEGIIQDNKFLNGNLII